MLEPKRPLKVFLCHSSQDKPVVQELHNRLLCEGWIDPWLDKEKLQIGDDFDLEIEKAIETTDAVIAFISSSAVKKTGYIQKELRLVYDAQMYIPDGELFTIPLRLEDCELPRRFTHWHWGDYFGEEQERTYQSLLKSLRRIYERVLKNETLEQAQQKSAEKDAYEESKKSRLKREEEVRLRLAKENVEQEVAERAEQERKEKGLREKRVRETKEKGQKPVTIKPRIGRQSVFLFGGFAFLVLGILLFFSLNKQLISVELTPEDIPSQIIIIPTLTVTVESGATSTPNNTLTPTPFPTEITDAKGVSMMLVPAGEFIMGSEKGEADEQPVRNINLDAFYIDKYEVTNLLYSKCVDNEACNKPVDTSKFENPKYADHPVAFVNWYMAKNYCDWRGARLPTEAEWEKAARGADGKTYPWGEDIDCSYSNYRRTDGIYCVEMSTVVGSYDIGKSIYGVYDLAGNVTEWVSSLKMQYPYDANDGRENSNSAGARILRGGSWNNKSPLIRSSDRSWNVPSEAKFDYGFRCVMDAP